MTLTIVELQKQHAEWQTLNFPDTTIDHVMLGLIEEVGELAHAHLKWIQGIRGTPEELTNLAKDALGDIIIYLVGVCTVARFDLREIRYVTFHDIQAFMPTSPTDSTASIRLIREIAAGVAQISDFHMWHYGICSLNIITLLVRICRYAALRNFDVQTIVEATWTQVSKRDWQAHPIDAPAHIDR